MTTASAGRERLTTLASGQIPDRPPVSFWRHFYTEENDAARFSEAMLGFHREFGWDWIKLNPRASYHLEDWGFLFEPSVESLTKPVKKHFPVQTADDWARITPRPATQGALGEQLEAVARVVKGAAGDPVLMTVFSPLSIAGDLVPDDGVLQRHMREHPDRVAEALDAITVTFERFVEAVIDCGADGIFFATTQWASRTHLDASAYERWGRPYDLRVLNRVRQAPFNLLHVCFEECLLSELSDYPVTFLNWGFADPGNPGLRSGFEASRKPVIGGVTRQRDLLESSPTEVFDRVAHTLWELRNVPWGCGPDCAVEPDTPALNLRAVKAALGSVGTSASTRSERTPLP